MHSKMKRSTIRPNPFYKPGLRAVGKGPGLYGLEDTVVGMFGEADDDMSEEENSIKGFRVD